MASGSSYTRKTISQEPIDTLPLIPRRASRQWRTVIVEEVGTETARAGSQRNKTLYAVRSARRDTTSLRFVPAPSYTRSIRQLTVFVLLLLLVMALPITTLARGLQARDPQAILYWSGESGQAGGVLTGKPTAQAGRLPAVKPPLQPVGQTGNWTMIFHDEFTGPALDTSKWTTCYFNFTVGNGCDHDQGELELYQPENVVVSNGTLKLQADRRTITASNGKTYDYTSGMISTGPTASNENHSRFAFQYGYMEMRAKIPSGKGLWPAFWTLPTDLSWPPEIDVFEILGDAPNVINMHYHYPTATGGDGDSGDEWTGPNFSTGWHTYAVDWEPHAITWYVDGIERRSYTDSSHIVSKPMYLVANLAVGGDWPGSPDRTTRFPSAFEIDYIRVWQRAA